jgi:hypothetical protein
MGERAVRLKHILKITANREIPETDQLDNSTEEEEDEKNIPPEPPNQVPVM